MKRNRNQLSFIFLILSVLGFRLDAQEDRSRNFFEVVEDVLADIESDFKEKNFSRLTQSVSIRWVDSSAEVPRSFQKVLKQMVVERLQRASSVRVVDCLECDSHRVRAQKDRVVLKTARVDTEWAKEWSQKNQVQSWMDIHFTYHPKQILIALTLVEARSDSILWSKTYQSETTRAAAYRQGVDFRQLEEMQDPITYEPESVFKPLMGYWWMPDLNETLQGFLAFGFRYMDRYSNRTKEIGAEVTYVFKPQRLFGSTDVVSAYGTFNFTIMVLHAWNWVGSLENFRKPRGSFYLGGGATYSAPFLGAVLRTGYEWRLGKSWSILTMVGYRPSSTVVSNNSLLGVVTGVELGLSVTHVF